MPVVVEEAVLPLLFLAVGGLLALLSLLKAAVWGMGAVASRVLGPWALEMPRSVEVGLILAAAVYLHVHTGLLLPLGVVAVGTGCATGSSWRAVRWATVLALLLCGLLASPLLRRGVLIEVPSPAPRWTSLFRGEAVNLYHRPGDEPPQRAVYVYHDDVSIREIRHPWYRLAELRTWATGGHIRPLTDAAPPTNYRAAPLPIGARPPHVTVLSSASGTELWHYGHEVFHVDAIALLGQGASLHGALLRCEPDPRPTGAPCIAALADVVVTETVLEVLLPTRHDVAEGPTTPRVWIERAEGCAALREVIQHATTGPSPAAAPLDALIQCFPLSLYEAGTEAFLPRVRVPEAFVEAMPLVTLWRWSLPQYVHDLHVVVADLVERQVLPGMRQAAAGAWWGVERLRWAVGELARGVAAARPPLAAAVFPVRVAMVGLWCGPAPRETPYAWSCHPPREGQAYYRLGAQAHRALGALGEGLMEALEVVPGLPSLYRWAWHAEWVVTRALLCGVRQAFTGGVIPLARRVVPLLVQAQHRLARAGPLVGRLVERAQASPLPIYVRRGVVAWGGLEYRWLRAECRLVYGLGEVAAVWLAGLLRGLGWTLAWGWSGACGGLRLYRATSLPVHLVVTLAQTTLLLLGLRNELRHLADLGEVGRPRGPVAGPVVQRAMEAVMPRTAVHRLLDVWVVLRGGCYPLVRYLWIHATLVVVLVGLTALPFTGRLYDIALHGVLPWVSSHSLLTFFAGDKEVGYRPLVLLVLVKMVVTVVLQRTVGSVVYRLIRDSVVAVGILGGLIVVVGAWSRRALLAQSLVHAMGSRHAVPEPPSA